MYIVCGIILDFTKHTTKKKVSIKHDSKHNNDMLFVFIAWMLTLVVFVILLRALHTIPIYTYTALEHHGQQLQMRTLFIISKILLALAFLMLMLHFILPSTTQDFKTYYANSSLDTVNSSHSTHTHNFSW